MRPGGPASCLVVKRRNRNARHHHAPRSLKVEAHVSVLLADFAQALLDSHLTDNRIDALSVACGGGGQRISRGDRGETESPHVDARPENFCDGCCCRTSARHFPGQCDSARDLQVNR
jgi:hypothetical protein